MREAMNATLDEEIKVLAWAGYNFFFYGRRSTRRMQLEFRIELGPGLCLTLFASSDSF